MNALSSETNEFHKRLSNSRLTAPNPRGTAPGESGDRASGVSAKVKAPNRLFSQPKCVEASDDVIERFLRDSRDRVKPFLSYTL